ncbi:hypothetical protein ZHAS_00021232 [Anopheles sinensis]|uniref:Uncharacterized protein n=1 Tax=Anopheles sinensis TaxID=74873 RepID=A0A084WRU2_ANOSI|nr:hypothetical protein ZHAS_00021232 [Anopheles sinensis]
MEYHMKMYPSYGGQCDYPGCRRPVSNLSCYTVPENAVPDGEDPDEQMFNSGTTTTTATTTEDEECPDECTPVPTPTAIGAYHPPDGGPPQLGYFVPISPVFFRSPQFRKRDTIDSNRSRRSTSYCGTSTPTPTTAPINNTVSSRRSSLISATASAASSQHQPPPIPQLPSKSIVLAGCDSKFAVSNNNFTNSPQSNSSSSNNNNQSNNLNGVSVGGGGGGGGDGVPGAGGLVGGLRQALGAHKRLQKSESAAYSYFNPKRFSSPPFGDLGGTTDRRLNLKNKTASLFRSKSKKEQRTYRSMNETIEVLADQVVEDEKVVSSTILLSFLGRLRFV